MDFPAIISLSLPSTLVSIGTGVWKRGGRLVSVCDFSSPKSVVFILCHCQLPILGGQRCQSLLLWSVTTWACMGSSPFSPLQLRERQSQLRGPGASFPRGPSGVCAVPRKLCTAKFLLQLCVSGSTHGRLRPLSWA